MSELSSDEAFTEFVAAHGARLVRSAELMCGDRGRAEDLVQTALEKTYVRWRKIDHAEDAYAYVYRAVLNGHRDWWRQLRGRETSTDTPPERAFNDRTSHLVSRDSVLRALATLTNRERSVVVLRYYDGQSEREIADILRIAPGTVKSTAARALGKLRQHPGLVENVLTEEKA